MSYIKNLLPPHSRIELPSNITGSANLYSSPKATVAQVLSAILGTILLLIGVIQLFNHFVVGVLFIFIGMGVHTWIRKSIETKLRFKYTVKLRAFILIPLFILAMVVQGRYSRQERIQEERVETQRQRHEDSVHREEEKQAQLLQIRNDSALGLIKEAKKLSAQKKYTAALEVFDAAITISPELPNCYLERAKAYKGNKDFQSALTDFNRAYSVHGDSEVLCQRGLCYLAMDDKQHAVNDFKQAGTLGHVYAQEFYEKVNPIKRRITGYHTVCCDGSISYSTGRGTCSHHKGVCGREAEYVEYREY